MTGLAPLLVLIAEHLRSADVAFALIGGLAVSVRTEPRFTRDIDLAVAVRDDAAAEALISRISPPFFVQTLVEHDALNRLATARLGHRETQPQPGPVLDLLFASSGVETEITQDAEVLEVLPDVHVPVARTGHLIALKLLSVSEDRPQDRVDLHALLAVADTEERQRVKSALLLIEQRGANRERPLLEDWAELLGEH